MAGLAIVLDLLRKNSGTKPPQSLHSYGAFSAAAAAAGTPFAFRAFLGNYRIPVAHCDAGVDVTEDYFSNLQSASRRIFEHESLQYTTKEYNLELKPLFSAFQWRMLGMTTLRSFLMFYLPLLEPHAKLEDEDDEDFLNDNQEEQHVDLVSPFKKSIKQIVRETTVVTTRRILERISVHYASQRIAWKLLKDVPKSAVRKAGRELPTLVYFFRVTRTTFRGHALGVAASWLVQVGIEIYRYVSAKVKPKDDDVVDETDKVIILRKKIAGATLRCSASLVFASIGAGIGATLFRPSAGQWIGCAVGDLAGPVIVTICLEKGLNLDL
uniref:Isopentenyl-diphosphate delta-isomerase n=2 Tax=Cucumis sativus TaxID=3659 RepID=A0A0A0K342_CUCSA